MIKPHHKILKIRDLTDSSFVLRFEKQGLTFKPGQYITVGKAKDINRREYSLYSPPEADWLEILVKEIPEGYLTPILRKVKEGDYLSVEGPFGFFTLPEEIHKQPLYFIATGTGISPFHCFAKSYNLTNYTLVHGIKHISEQYEHDQFNSACYTSCLSSGKGDYKGRVTDWLKEHKTDKKGHYFLCGNSDMIYEVYEILKSRNIPQDHIHGEVYY